MKFFTYKSAVCLQNKFDRGFITIDGTEMLCTSKRSSSIARHFIPSTFFCQSAVCLLKSQNVNKKPIGIFKWAFLDPKLLKINFS